MQQNIGKPGTDIKSAEAQLICRLLDAMKHTINTGTAATELAFDVESEVLTKMRSSKSTVGLEIDEAVKASASEGRRSCGRD
ncbi:hypothetical protein ERJ75_000167300 [Trypanosoma vivax]|nr:hypothetical protein ERJ75_000167300 [Trypanosoma vivax]